LTSINNINSWDVSGITNMNSMFYGSQFNQDISGWTVSNVTDMGSMFESSVFDQPIGSWNVSNVTEMSGMFESSIFNQVISSWNVSSVSNLFGFMNNKISYSYYDDILNYWSLLTLYNGVTLDMGTIQYTAAGSTARENIISNYLWTINDGGLV
jgi:hypothetical protein